MVSGTGKECCYTNKNEDKLPHNSLKFAIWNDGKNPIDGGYFTMHISATEMTFTFLACNGTELYTSPSVKPRHMAAIKPVVE